MFDRVVQKAKLYCIDNIPLSIRGQDNFDYQRLDIIFNPCIEDLENNVCVNKTFDGLMEYLGVPELYLLYNR